MLPAPAGLPAARWDELVPPGRGPLRHAFLAASTAVDLPGFAYRPLVVDGDAGRVAAQAPAYAYDLDLGLFLAGGAARLLAAARRARPGLLRPRVLEVGCPVALCEPMCAGPGVREEAAVEALVRLATVEAGRAGASLLVVRDVEREREPVRRALRRLGLDPVPMPPTHVFDVAHAGFEDYLAAMRSPYRARARACFERSRGLTAELVPAFAPLAPELARLWRCVYDRADEVRREVLPEAFFRAMAAVPGVRLLALRRGDGSVAAFGLLLEDRPWLRFLYTGFEDAARAEGAYFRLVYEVIRHGVDGGFARVELGITSAEPKLFAGAHPVPLEAWVRHESRALQRVLATLLSTCLRPRAAGVARARVFRQDRPAGGGQPAALSPRTRRSTSAGCGRA